MEGKVLRKEYECIKEFALSNYDEHGRIIENEDLFVPIGSIWESCDFSSMSDIRLEGNLGWLEISEDTLKAYFVEAEVAIP